MEKKSFSLLSARLDDLGSFYHLLCAPPQRASCTRGLRTHSSHWVHVTSVEPHRCPFHGTVAQSGRVTVTLVALIGHQVHLGPLSWHHERPLVLLLSRFVRVSRAGESLNQTHRSPRSCRKCLFLSLSKTDFCFLMLFSKFYQWYIFF